MKPSLGVRFWIEAVAAALTSFLALITWLWKDWIEIVFRVDPDSGNGSLERLIVAGCLVATVLLIFLARSEWRRTRTALA